MEQAHLVKGYELAGYVKEITYSASLYQVVALVDISINCKQHIELMCYGLVDGNEKSDLMYWWENRYRVIMNNWGSPKGTNGCDCSTRNGM